MFSASQGMVVRVCVCVWWHPCFLWRDTYAKIVAMHLFYKLDEQPDLSGNLSYVILSLLSVASILTFRF